MPSQAPNHAVPAATVMLVVDGAPVGKGGVPQSIAVPGADEWAYFKSKNITLVRLPFKWERMQPNSSGPLSPVYLGLVHKQVQLAKNNR